MNWWKLFAMVVFHMLIFVPRRCDFAICCRCWHVFSHLSKLFLGGGVNVFEQWDGLATLYPFKEHSLKHFHSFLCEKNFWITFKVTMTLFSMVGIFFGISQSSLGLQVNCLKVVWLQWIFPHIGLWINKMHAPGGDFFLEICTYLKAILSNLELILFF